VQSVSIKAVLLGALALIGLAFLIQNTLGLFAVRETAGQTTAIARSELPTVKTLGDIKFLATRYRLNGARLIMERSATKAKAIEDLNAQILSRTVDLVGTYKQLMNDPAEKLAFTAYEAAWKDYGAVQDKAVQLARAGSPEEAASIFGTEGFERFNAVLAGLDKAIAVNEEQVERALDAVSGTSNLTFVVGLVDMLLMLALIAGVAAVILRRVTRPLESITAAMQRLAGGDLATAIPYAARGDEVGRMAKAVQVFKENAQRVRSLEDDEKRANADRMRRAQVMVDVVAEVGQAVRRAAEGDFSVRLALSTDDPELGQLVSGINQINGVVDEATSEFADILGNVARGDLTRKVVTDYHGRFGTLKDALNQTVERLSETVTTIQAAAREVDAAAHEIRSGANDLSSRTEQQASSLEETAATAEELAASVKASSSSSREALDLARQATGVAQEGGDIVGRAVDAMARIEQASQKISDITDVIDEIAFQTNLLALNAAVEAARAGEAGKGFAVVASEVRTLAQRSSEAAKEITALIDASVKQVGEGVELVRSAGDALSRIMEASTKVTETVSRVSEASGEQASGIDEMSQAVAHMDEMTQQNAALAEQSAASAAALTEQITRLANLVDEFRTRTTHERGPNGRSLREPPRLVRAM
jgi:methyl-accepting chemotaxis protein